MLFWPLARARACVCKRACASVRVHARERMRRCCGEEAAEEDLCLKVLCAAETDGKMRLPQKQTISPQGRRLFIVHLEA